MAYLSLKCGNLCLEKSKNQHVLMGPKYFKIKITVLSSTLII